MRTRVRKWGNSLALRIPKQMAEELGLSSDAEVQVVVVDDRLEVRKAPGRPVAYDLDELLAGVTDDNRHDEVEWGPSVGRGSCEGMSVDELGSSGPEYVPRRGDLVWLSFNPQAGHEKAGRRPALVLSPERYNRRVGLALICPITTQRKGYPFEVELPSDSAVRGVVLSDQVRSLDWRACRADRAGAAPADVVEETVRRLEVLLL